MARAQSAPQKASNIIIASVQVEFIWCSDMTIYLDNSATTQVREEVVEAMLPYLKKHWGNPSSIHQAGREALEAIRLARQQVSGLLNCLPSEVYFSACGTMSNNAAILGRARFAEANQLGRHLITSQIEHPSVLGPAQYLESQGWQVTYLAVDRRGLVKPQDLTRALRPDTSIVSIMWANNEIGTVQKIEEMVALLSGKDVFFHTDAVQVPGKMPLDMSAVEVSALSLSGHKFYAPKGVGILFLRGGQNLMPIVFGGGQEMGILPGTEGVANIVAIGKAAELARAEFASNSDHLRRLQKIILEELSSLSEVKISGSPDCAERLPGHCSFYLPGTEGEALVMRADLRGICISSGSACHKGIIEASQVMRAIGLSNHEAMGSIRISAGRFNNEEECRQAAREIAKILRAAPKSSKSSRLFSTHS
jgi:cysteine desulfurase